MSNGTLAKVAAKTAAEVCKHYPLGEQAKGVLRDGMTPRQFIDSLVEKNLFPEAVRFLTHALPKREAVWWACLCSRSAYGSGPPAKVAVLLQAAEKWVADPNDANRRAAKPTGDAADMNTSAACAAFAAVWSGSLGPADAPPVPPGDFLTAQGAAGAVMLAAMQAEPDKIADRFRQFVTLGLDVASGTNRWK